MRYIFRKLKGNYIIYGLGCLLVASQSLMSNVLSGQLYRTIILLGEGGAFGDALRVLGLILLGVAGVSLALLLGEALYQRACVNADQAMRRDIVRGICRMPISRWSREPMGRWISLFSRDVDTASEGYRVQMISLMTQVLQLLGGGVLSFLVSPAMTIFAVICGGVYFLCIYLFKNPVRRVQEALWDALAKSSAVLAEMTPSLVTIRFYQMEGYFHAKYQQAAEKSAQMESRHGRLTAASMTLRNFGYSFSYVGSLIFGLSLVSRGSLALADMMYVWSLTMGISYGMQSVGTQLLEFQKNAAAARRVEEGCTLPQERRGGEGLPAKEAVEIRLDQVSFSYDPEKPVLRDISTVIHPGEKVAVVGLSGSGKTTLVKLLMGLYEPDRGDIWINGVRTRDASLHSLRGQFSYLPQQPYLFDESLRENLQMVRPEAQPAQLEKACTMAGLQPLLERLPEGLDTRAGENGAQLSGGERQRLGAARCFLKDSPVYIMDEMTSALDSRLEEELLHALYSMENRTVICITHRLMAARLADRILVMEGGRIVEDGSHEALLQRGGLYARLLENA